jgi:hypothetical protein
MNAHGERFAFGMSRPKLSINGAQISSYFLDRASESWHVVRRTVSDLDREKGGQMRFDDLVNLCKNISCYLPENDLNDLWQAVSFGERDGVSTTREFLKLFGGFVRGESSGGTKSCIPVYTKSNLKYTPSVSSSGYAVKYSQGGNTEESVSLPLPHFYGVNQSDPTCMHKLSGVRSFHSLHHVLPMKRF